MFLLNSVDDSVEEVRDILEFNDIIKQNIEPIPEENINVNELFEKFHPEYFDFDLNWNQNRSNRYYFHYRYFLFYKIFQWATKLLNIQPN